MNTNIQNLLTCLLNSGKQGVLKRVDIGSFTIFIDDERLNNSYFSESIVQECYDQGYIGGGPIHGYYITPSGKERLAKCLNS